jgi:hypothetical protein
MDKEARNTLLRLLAIGVLVLLLVLGFTCAKLRSRWQSPARQQSAVTQPTATQPTSRPVMAEDFVGVWSGKWDEKWKVRFTITRDTADTNRFKVKYAWEENVGKPLQRRSYDAKLQEGVLTVGAMIDITLSGKNDGRAQAVGNFSNQRVANLARETAHAP